MFQFDGQKKHSVFKELVHVYNVLSGEKSYFTKELTVINLLRGSHYLFLKITF